MKIFKDNETPLNAANLNGIMKVHSETGNSTSTVRVISLEGAASYSDIKDMLLFIRSQSDGDTLGTTLDVNGFGAKNIVFQNASGSGTTLVSPWAWTRPGQVYCVVYDGTSFVLQNAVTKSGESTEPVADRMDFYFTGDMQSTTLESGKYLLECWGAQGGYRTGPDCGGKGGYSKGILTLSEPTLVNVNVGGFGGITPVSSGNTVEGGYNGGGSRYGYFGGGGASDIRLRGESLYERVIVAGGGGAEGAEGNKGGYGGGEEGETIAGVSGDIVYGGGQAERSLESGENSQRPYKIVHYLNQFYGGIGGEEMADIPPEIRDGTVGPGIALQTAFSTDATITKTIICGDNYFNSNLAAATATIMDWILAEQPDIIITGPAFNAGRYGMACGAVCSAAREMGIPSVTGMYPENPGYDIYFDDASIMVETTAAANGMRHAVPAIVAAVLSVMENTSGNGAGRFGIGGAGRKELGSGGGGWFGGNAATPVQSGDKCGGGGGSGWVWTGQNASEGWLLEAKDRLSKALTLCGNKVFLAPDGAAAIGNERNGHVRITPVAPEAEVDESLDAASWGTIISYAEQGLASTKFSVGEEKRVMLSTGETLTFVILGFDHDNLTAGGKAKITFGMKNLMTSIKPMDSSVMAEDWENSEMRNVTMPEIFSKLPPELQEIIKPVNKTSLTFPGNVIKTTSDNLFLLSRSEIRGSGNSDEGGHYAYYIDQNPGLIKSIADGSAINYQWWLRSKNPYYIAFYIVDKSGSIDYKQMSDPLGVSFCFCI